MYHILSVIKKVYPEGCRRPVDVIITDKGTFMTEFVLDRKLPTVGTTVDLKIAKENFLGIKTVIL